MSIEVLSPAKLNLNLHIIGQRDDGYHLLESYFQLLEFGDTMNFAAQSREITITPAVSGIPIEENLIFKAAKLLKTSVGNSLLGAKITLQKRLPMGGGLGGGSSNAATTLVALNKLWKLNLSIDELAAFGLKLGADVPFFIRGSSAWVEGIGERITPHPSQGHWYVVLRPRVSVSTAAIFSHPELTRDTPSSTVAAVLRQGGRNDCEPVVRSLYSEIDSTIEWLNKFSPARLTGTGACVFAAFKSKEDAEAIFRQRPETCDGFVAQGINNSPVEQIS
ncbi:4-(cytidine 5'-diphospho)-2-C-methyl-D-erythritol kinase [uncultured Umboniibacter sp.]|uniref:4-(cytidine 5'-diphospho)-2-C-methyl-D-erythritol kinase n=1 Tax=uncultured Umboniibacter sp. TaxID=1798917 RepID=UPI002623B9EC|nr:4-(cytidine 5'-diphospho)-2-C-methyl-D-erythritol kinase [uncultured Umboniibacter sp.]